MQRLALLVEGDLDESIGRRIVEEAGGTVMIVYGKQGIGYIEKKIAGFNRAAVHTPTLTLADLMDTEIGCPVRVVEEWLPRQHENMLFRLVVREVESWILSDRANVAQFLGVSRSEIPHHPEHLSDPKQKVVNLARTSNYRRIRELLVPEAGVSASEGPGYTREMQKFVRGDWKLKNAAVRLESLERCVSAVTRFLKEQDP